MKKLSLLFTIAAIALLTSSCEERTTTGSGLFVQNGKIAINPSTGAIDPASPAKIGDYYFEDGSISPDKALANNKNKIIGIVFQINGKSGKAMGLTQFNCAWTQNKSDFVSIPNARNADGRTNSAAVWVVNPGFEKYPAFLNCHNLNSTPPSSYHTNLLHTWYLPGGEELTQMHNAKQILRTSCLAIEAPTLLDAEYWCSNDANGDAGYHAYCINFQTGLAHSDNVKNYKLNVRPIFAF